MNDRTAGAILLVIGVVAIFAAIVGGGIKIQQIEVGSVQSKWRQWLLAAFGLVIAIVGLVMALPDDNPSNSESTENVEAIAENAPTVENAAAVDANADVDENAADANVTDENTAYDNNGEAAAQ